MKAYTPNLKSFVQLGLFARHFDVLLWHLLTWVHPALCTSAMHMPTDTKPQHIKTTTVFAKYSTQPCRSVNGLIVR